HHEEVSALVEEILIPVTSFFRNPESFEYLKTVVLPRYMKKWDETVPLRIWVPGCSTGEEAYSIAITLSEFLDNAKLHAKLQIFASDISEPSIQKARTGVYPESIARDVDKGRLRRFFQKEEEGYRIAKEIRDICLFSKQDVTTDPPFARIDIVSCRNVLIYFAPELQKRAIRIFHYALNPGGILWLGRSESISQYSHFFGAADKTNKFYTKKEIANSARIEFPIVPYPASSSIVVKSKFAEVRTPPNDIQREVDRITIQQYAPPGVVINDSFEI